MSAAPSTRGNAAKVELASVNKTRCVRGRLWKSNITSTEDGQTDRQTRWGRCGSEEFPSCWKLIHHPVCRAKQWWISSLPAPLLSPPLHLSVFNPPPLCQKSDSLLLSSTRSEKIKLWLIGGADDHTASPALLSVFNSYLAHSTRLPPSLCVLGRLLQIHIKTKVLCKWVAHRPELSAAFCAHQRQKTFLLHRNKQASYRLTCTPVMIRLQWAHTALIFMRSQMRH